MINPSQLITTPEAALLPVELVPFKSPEFAVLLAGLKLSDTENQSLSAVLPYSVFIKNSFGKHIIGFSLAWTTKSAAGETYTDQRSVIDALKITGLIRPYDIILSTINGTLDPMYISGVTENTEELIRLQDAVEVTITLEAVLLNDGSTFGRDRFGALSQMKARFKSEYNLYSSVNAQSDDAVVITHLRSLANQTMTKPGSNTARDEGESWYVIYTAVTARELIRISEMKGVKEMRWHIQRALETKPYPIGIVNQQ